MRLQNLLSLVDGILLSSPSISSFEQLRTKAHRVKRGDIFIAQDGDDIDLAIDNGAYGIIFEKELEIVDSDIAWIRVDSVEVALLRLLRFHILDSSPKSYAVNSITITLASMIIQDEKCIVLKGDLFSNLSALWSLPKDATVFYLEESNFSSLFVESYVIPRVASRIEIMEKTFFETSFILNDHYYEKQNISPFFMPHLSRLVHLLDQRHITYKIDGINSAPHFAPLFVDLDLSVKRFGQSQRVVIFERDISLMLEQIEFMKIEARYAQIIYIIPKEYRSRVALDSDLFTYESIEDVLDILKTKTYNFALVGGQDREILQTAQKSSLEATLFD